MVYDYKDFFEQTYKQYALEWRTAPTLERRFFWRDELWKLEGTIMRTVGFEFADELHQRYLGK